MSRLVSTLATIWRLARPYFFSDDRWAGRVLLGAVITIELSIVAINVMLNQWNNRFYNALQERNWDTFVYELVFFCVLAAIYIVLAVYQLYLNQWLQIRWRRWMTRQYLDHWLDGANHYRMQLLGDAADNPDQRIAEDINLFVERTLSLSIGLLSAIVTLCSFVVILWTLSAAAPLHLFGTSFTIPGYLVWAALLYADGRHRADPSRRLAAGRAQFPPAAVRGRFPFQPCAGAGELRADRAARRRDRRARTAARPLRPCGRQFSSDHAAHQEADLPDRRLRANLDRLSLHRDQPRLFRRRGPARRTDADRLRLRQRAERAVVLRQRLSPARGMARGDRAARRLQHRRRAGQAAATATPAIEVSAREGKDAPRDRRSSGAAAAGNAAGRRRRPRHLRRGERVLVTGPSGAGKSTLVPRHRGHVAVRRGHDHGAARAPR